MEQIVVLDAATIGENSIFDSFKNLGNLRVFATTTSEERLQHIANASIIITNKVIIDKEIMDSCPAVRLICLTATGMNNVDLVYAKERGIIVKNFAGYSTESVMQHTFAMLLSLLQHTEYYSHYVSSKQYSNHHLFTHIGPGYMELNGRTWELSDWGQLGAVWHKWHRRSGAKSCIIQLRETTTQMIIKNLHLTNFYKQPTLFPYIHRSTHRQKV